LTIAIAAICDADNVSQTGNIILCTDTRIAWELETSNDNGYKIYDLPHGLFMTIGNSVSRSHQFNGYLHAALSEIDSSDPSFVEKVRMAIEYANATCRVWIRAEILAGHCISVDEFLHDKTLANRAELEQELQDATGDIDNIVCGFGPTKAPMIFHSDGVRICEFAIPGFACAGSGARVALDWLNFRKQSGFYTTQRTFYHVREAHSHADLSIGAGGACHMLLLRAGKRPKDIGQLTPMLQDWVNKFYPRNTDILDQQQYREMFVASFDIGDLEPTRSVSQTSEDQQ
jgi:hypothetical protein